MLIDSDIKYEKSIDRYNFSQTFYFQKSLALRFLNIQSFFLRMFSKCKPLKNYILKTLNKFFTFCCLISYQFITKIITNLEPKIILFIFKDRYENICYLVLFRAKKSQYVQERFVFSNCVLLYVSLDNKKQI